MKELQLFFGAKLLTDFFYRSQFHCGDHIFFAQSIQNRKCTERIWKQEKATHFMFVTALFLAVFSIAACSDSDYTPPPASSASGSGNSTTSSSSSNQTINNGSSPLARALADTAISRDPFQLPPYSFEVPFLDQGDNYLLAGFTSRESTRVVTRNGYAPVINRLKEKAGIIDSVTIIVDNDCRLNPSIGQPPGGVAGHNIIMLDGKFLDILSEYANYLALFQLGFITQNRINALDTIVTWHNNNGGVAPEILYPYGNLNDETKALSDGYFEELTGVILYHEFAHYFLYHMLDKLRAQGTLAQGLVHYTTLNEDDSDVIAGFLSAKAGHSLARSQELIDLLAFYGQRQGSSPIISFAQIEQSATIQFIQNGPTHSSLAARKSSISSGFQQFQNLE